MSVQLEASLERDGFNLGWDYFCFGMPMPFDAAANLVSGYEAARERGVPSKENDRYVRKWLQLRLGALRRERAVRDNVTPDYLKEIEDKYCPVSLVRLTYATRGNTDWSIDRVNNNGAYARGNLIVVSSRVNRAKRALDFNEVYARAKGEVEDDSLTRPEWERLAVIMLGAYQYAEEDGARLRIVLPCCARLPPGVTRSIAMDLQNRLVEVNKVLSASERERCLREMKRLLKPQSRAAFKELITRFERRTSKVAFPPDTWRNPGVWKAYAKWLETLDHESRVAVFEHFKRHLRLRVDSIGLQEWSRDTRGYVPHSRSQRTELKSNECGADEETEPSVGDGSNPSMPAGNEPCLQEAYEPAALVADAVDQFCISLNS